MCGPRRIVLDQGRCMRRFGITAMIRRQRQSECCWRRGSDALDTDNDGETPLLYALFSMKLQAAEALAGGHANRCSAGGPECL